MCGNCIRIANGFICGAGAPVGLFRLGGKTVTAEWHSYCGPTVLTKKFDVSDKQPSENSPLWAMFDAWKKHGLRVDVMGYAIMTGDEK